MRIYRDLIRDDVVIRINIQEYNTLFNKIRKYGYKTVNEYLQKLIKSSNNKKVEEKC
jgi:hypothetical protein